jgi:hypothetical protein
MLGYYYTVKRLDSEIGKKLGLTPSGFWTDEETELYRSLTLASWKTALYPEWPKKLVAEGLVTVDHKNVLNSVFLCPLKYVLQHIGHDMKHEGPTVIQEAGVTEDGDAIRPTIYHDRIAKCDMEEVVEIDRWDMS